MHGEKKSSNKNKNSLAIAVKLHCFLMLGGGGGSAVLKVISFADVYDKWHVTSDQSYHNCCSCYSCGFSARL